ncbi:hypothetical protein GJJ64_03435 [Pedobacter sp. HX-22-1]|uniref:Uncharacterized protein n=1 Tax=Pedobacter puniceum TaxID=2666136 RepID=A0A7K0FJZ7_9SPHI|nr:hypothetical protein [Pedobacter puniceum]MRX46233.1 hypothetical protein [Pedobacter puniceum]
MKANHNNVQNGTVVTVVVVNISSSKNESKSQQWRLPCANSLCCCKYQ